MSVLIRMSEYIFPRYGWACWLEKGDKEGLKISIHLDRKFDVCCCLWYNENIIVEFFLKTLLFRRNGKHLSGGCVWKFREMSKHDLKSLFIDSTTFIFHCFMFVLSINVNKNTDQRLCWNYIPESVVELGQLPSIHLQPDFVKSWLNCSHRLTKTRVQKPNE